MTTATEAQPTIREIKTVMRHASDCNTQVSGWAGEICNCHPREHTESTPIQPTITLSNFRVTYHAPRYEDGRVLYDGYCAILANDAALDGVEVRVFDVPDVDEGQLAAAMFACEAMNQHERLVKALRNLMIRFEQTGEAWMSDPAMNEAREALATITSKQEREQ